MLHATEAIFTRSTKDVWGDVHSPLCGFALALVLGMMVLLLFFLVDFRTA
jgi:hypothetical protein